MRLPSGLTPLDFEVGIPATEKRFNRFIWIWPDFDFLFAVFEYFKWTGEWIRWVARVAEVISVNSY